MLRHPRQVLVNRHQVISLTTRVREAFLEEFIEGAELVKPPVLSCPNLAEVAPEIDEFPIPFALHPFLPSQDLLNPGEHKQGSPAIELRRHQRLPVNPQAGQANQGHLLRVDERAWIRSSSDFRDTAP